MRKLFSSYILVVVMSVLLFSQSLRTMRARVCIYLDNKCFFHRVCKSFPFLIWNIVELHEFRQTNKAVNQHWTHAKKNEPVTRRAKRMNTKKISDATFNIYLLNLKHFAKLRFVQIYVRFIFVLFSIHAAHAPNVRRPFASFLILSAYRSRNQWNVNHFSSLLVGPTPERTHLDHGTKTKRTPVKFPFRLSETAVMVATATTSAVANLPRQLKLHQVHLNCLSKLLSLFEWEMEFPILYYLCFLFRYFFLNRIDTAPRTDTRSIIGFFYIDSTMDALQFDSLRTKMEIAT